jgi:hypothetical protein
MNLDVLTIIAQTSIRSYRVLLALPRFGRRSLQSSFQFLIQNHFTILTIIKLDTRYDIYHWQLNGRYYRPVHPNEAMKPAKIQYHPNGQEEFVVWYQNGQIHRSVNLGPALINYCRDGHKIYEIWYNNGHKHRMAAPAVIKYNCDGDKIRESWYLGGRRHRVDGPAIINYDSDDDVAYQSYYLYDVEYSEEDYEAELLRLTQ